MPAFLIGCAQMRILSTRTLTAAIIGMVTPIWILTGFGILNLNDFSLPEFSNIFSALRDRTLLHMTIATGTTIILCAIAGIGCMLRTYNYNTTGRSFNGVIYILSITSIVLVIVDYTNISTYIPLLNCCTAYHVAHFFASHSRRHSYIGIITVLALYIGLYIWSALL
jgi:hypothetical protein